MNKKNYDVMNLYTAKIKLILLRNISKQHYAVKWEALSAKVVHKFSNTTYITILKCFYFFIS